MNLISQSQPFSVNMSADQARRTEERFQTAQVVQENARESPKEWSQGPWKMRKRGSRGNRSRQRAQKKWRLVNSEAFAGVDDHAGASANDRRRDFWATSDITLPSSPSNAPKPPPTTSNSTISSADSYISTLLLTSSDLILLRQEPFAPNRETMEEEDDDFYGPNEGSEAPNGDLKAPAETNGQSGAKDVKTEEALESGEEGEEEETSDSVQSPFRTA